MCIFCVKINISTGVFLNFKKIQVLSNGKYKNVEHRAVTHKEKDRLSLVTFCCIKQYIFCCIKKILVHQNSAALKKLCCIEKILLH